MEMGDVLTAIKVDLTDKFGDKEFNGYTWEITENVRDSNTYILRLAQIKKSGEYFEVLSDLIYKDVHKTKRSAEEHIKLKIARYMSGIDEFRLDERIEENIRKLREN